jgi:hypothetical protein
VWDRILATLRGRSIDDRLLAGELPEATGSTRRRSARLLDPEYRAAVAVALRRTVDEVEQDRRFRISPRLHLRTKEVMDAGPLMLELADEIENDPSVHPRGVILADRLVRDGDSPLYSQRDETVESAVRHARAALQLG